MSTLLTEDEAYLAMRRYLEAEYERSPSDGVGALLGAFSLLSDGRPADPAVQQDWLSAVSAIRDAQATFVCSSDNHSFEGTRLHDAVIHGLSLDWKNGEVQADLQLLGGVDATLIFHDVKSVLVPRAQPWGPSASINDARAQDDGTFTIEMQSGDELRIQANGWSLRTAGSRGEA